MVFKLKHALIVYTKSKILTVSLVLLLITEKKMLYYSQIASKWCSNNICFSYEKGLLVYYLQEPI